MRFFKAFHCCNVWLTVLSTAFEKNEKKRKQKRRTEQNRTEQNRTEQNRTEQNILIRNIVGSGRIRSDSIEEGRAKVIK